MTATIAPPPAPSCPACRYDLSGQVATWDAAGQCPIGGTCPECGERLDWAFVIVRGGRVHGFIEDAYGLRRRLTWAWRTTLWALWPWRFWGRVGDARVRPLGWVWWVLLMVWLPSMVTGAGTLAAYIGLYRWSSGMPIGFSAAKPTVWLGCLLGLQSDIRPLLEGSLGRWIRLETSPVIRGLLLEILAWPVAMMVASGVPQMREVRRGLIARALTFSLTPLAAAGLIGLAISATKNAFWFVAIYLDKNKMLPPGVHDDNWLFHTRQFLNQLIEHAVPAFKWLCVAWVPLWWLAAMQRGFKLERAAQIWIVQLILINVILYFLFGPRVDPIRW